MYKEKSLKKITIEIQDFYKAHPPDISIITDINKRHFRMVLPIGKFLKIPDIIRTPQDLQKWLIRLKPLDVYYSTSCWLDPTSIRPRPKKRDANFITSGILLSNDIFFDIDITPLSRRNLDRAREDTIELLDHLVSLGYKCKYIAFSGSKGFHLAFSDQYHKVIPDPFDREMEIIQRRKGLLKEIENAKFLVDTAVTCDTRRIVRVPGTINSKTGIACTIISRQDLKGSINDLLRHCPALPSAKRVPYFNLLNIKLTGFFPHILKILHLNKDMNIEEFKDERLKSGYYYTTYLQSNILGIKSRHAVLLSFKNKSQKKVERIINDLIEKFKLTDVYLFKLPSRIQVISLKSVQRNRLQKILDFTHAENASLLRKYNVTSIRVGPFINERMDELEPPIRFLKTVTSKTEINNTTFISAGHLNFLKKNTIDCYNYPNQHGSVEFKVIDAVIKI